MLERAQGRVLVQSWDSGPSCSSGPLLLIGAPAGALAVLPLLIVVVSVAVVVDVAEYSLLLLLRAARFVHHRVQRPGAGLDLGPVLQAAPASCPRPGTWARPVVHKWVVVAAQRAAKGGPAAVDTLQGHVGAVEHRVTGGAVAGPRAGVTGRPVGQVAAALRTIAATGAAALILSAEGSGTAGLWGGGGGWMVQSRAGGAALGRAGRTVGVAGSARGVVGAQVRRSPAAASYPMGPPGDLGRLVVATASAEGPAGEVSQCLGVQGRGTTVVAQRRVGSGGATGVVGPHGEGDGVLGEGVVVWVGVSLGVQEALSVLRGLLESAPLQLPLCPCGDRATLKTAQTHIIRITLLLPENRLT